MWHNALEADLKLIFGVKKILFGTPMFSKEQDVIFFQQESATNSIKNGKAIARVYGKISIIGLLGKNKSGFLSKKIQLADAKLTNRFVFEREEEQLALNSYEERFNVYSVGIIYFYKEQYNPPPGKIKSENIIWRIIKKVKGVFNG